MDEVVDKMLSLAVLPIQWTNGQCLRAERIRVHLTERGKLHLGESMQSRRRFFVRATRDLAQGRPDVHEQPGAEKRQPATRSRRNPPWQDLWIHSSP